MASQRGKWGPWLAIVCWLYALSAWAQAPAADPARTKEAREAYTHGQQLFRSGDFANALSSFAAAYEAVANPIVLLSMAECQVRLEAYAAAVDSLNRYLRERPQAPDREQVEAQLAKLSERPGTVSVVSSPLGAAILVDGANTGKVTPAELTLAAGDHTLALELPGHVRMERPLAVAIGGRDAVQLTLDPVVAAEAPPPPAPPPQVEATPPTERVPLYVAAALTGAGLATGAILGGLALAEKRAFDDKPTKARADRGERLALFADVGFGVAAAAAVTAIVLLTAGGQPAAEKTALSVVPALSRHAAGLSGNVRF